MYCTEVAARSGQYENSWMFFREIVAAITGALIAETIRGKWFLRQVRSVRRVFLRWWRPEPPISQLRGLLASMCGPDQQTLEVMKVAGASCNDSLAIDGCFEFHHSYNYEG